MIEWEPNKNDANLNIPVDGQVASICWNEQTKLLTMSLAYSAVYGMGERYNVPPDSVQKENPVSVKKNGEGQ